MFSTNFIKAQKDSLKYPKQVQWSTTRLLGKTSKKCSNLCSKRHPKNTISQKFVKAKNCKIEYLNFIGVLSKSGVHQFSAILVLFGVNRFFALLKLKFRYRWRRLMANKTYIKRISILLYIV